MSFSKSVPNGL
jgi:hypothetical protein